MRRATDNATAKSKRMVQSDAPDAQASNKKAKVQGGARGQAESEAEQPAAKPKHSKARSKAANKVTEPSDEPAAAAKQEKSTRIGLGRQAAQGVEYKDKSTLLVLPDSKVAVKQQQTADNEADALQKTQTESPAPRRQATQFVLVL